MKNIDRVIDDLLKPILMGEKIDTVWSEELEQYLFLKKFLCQNSIWYRPCSNYCPDDGSEPNRSYQKCVNVTQLLVNLKEMRI